MEDAAAYIGWGIPGAVITLMAVGLLWSPVAAIICLLIARIRGLREDGYGSAGFRYSLLFLLPWIYLALRMAGVPPSRVVERIGYGLLYGVWGVSALAFVGGGLAAAGSFLWWGETRRWSEVTPPGAAVLIIVGLGIAVLGFVSLRRLLRRHVLRGLSRSNTGQDYEPSAPMRTAYAALHVLWLLGAASIFLEGTISMLYPGVPCGDASIPRWVADALPFWTCAAVMALIWNWARKRFSFKTADSWDYPPSPTPNLLPPDDAYITPYSHFYRMIVIPAVVALALLVFAFILYAMGGGDMVSC